jgi:hypothetical protein
LTLVSFSDSFFSRYNKEHRHSGIAMLTPEMVHYGRAEEVIAARRLWINPPAKLVQNSIDGPNAEKTSRVFDARAICSTAPDALEGPQSNCSGEIQSIATLNSIVRLSQNR